jgi:hypothetical protein
MPKNRHKDIAEVVNLGGPYASLRYTNWILLVNAYKNMSRILQVSDIGASVLDFLDKDEFQRVTGLHIILLAYRGPSVAHIYSAHINIKKSLLYTGVFPRKKQSFLANFFCRSDDTVQENNDVIKITDNSSSFAMFSPDGKWFLTHNLYAPNEKWWLTSNFHGNIILTNTATGLCIKDIKKHAGARTIRLHDVSVDAAGTVMILIETANEKNYLHFRYDLLNCRTGKYDRVLEVNGWERFNIYGQCDPCVPSPDFLKISSDGKYIVWHLKNSTEMTIWNVEQKQSFNAVGITLPRHLNGRLSCNRDMTRFFLQQDQHSYNSHYEIYDCSALPRIEYLHDIKIPGHSRVRDISSDGKYMLFESPDDDIIRVFVLETLRCILIDNIKWYHRCHDKKLFFVDEGRKIVFISQFLPCDSRYNHFDLQVISVNTGEILATKVLPEYPAYYAAHKDRFLLGFPSKGIQLFSYDSLIKEKENSLDVLTEQQFSPW